MKKFFLFLIILAMSFVGLSGCMSPTKDEIKLSVEQIPNFGKMVFTASAKTEGFFGNKRHMRIGETFPNIPGELYESHCFAIYTSLTDEMYIAFLDGNHPPKIISIHKLK